MLQVIAYSVEKKWYPRAAHGAGADMLAALNRELSAHGIRFRIVEAHAHVRDLLRAEGLEAQIGYLGRHSSIDQVFSEHLGSVTRG